MAIFGCAKNMCTQIDFPQLRHVIYNDQIRIEVDYPANPGGQQIGEVHPRVIQRLIESSANGVRDLSPDEVGVEVVEIEVEVRKGGGDNPAELQSAVRGGDEVEHDVLRAGSVLEHREYAGY